MRLFSGIETGLVPVVVIAEKDFDTESMGSS